MVPYINCFEVPPEDDEAFLERWRAISHYMRAKPGFLGLRLHRSTGDGAANRFVNYVHWRSAADLAAAHDDGFRRLAGAPAWTSRVGQLYEIIESAGVVEL